MIMCIGTAPLTTVRIYAKNGEKEMISFGECRPTFGRKAINAGEKLIFEFF